MNRRIIGFDTLRFIAIILIVIYHCFPEILPGGFIAVEIFFGLSGFLIGAKLIREFSLKNEINGGYFRGFWRFACGRLRRLFPALLFCMIIALSIAYFTNPDLLTSARENSLYAATFSTNIAAIINGSSYESRLIPNLFNHTWFLALELQVCLIIYIVFAFFFYLNKKNRNIKLSLLCFMISVISFVLMAIYGGRFGLYDRAYFGIDSHIGTFFLGAGLAALMTGKEYRADNKRVIWTVFLILEIIMVVVITPFLNYASSVAFIGALPITGALSFLMIISVLKLQPQSDKKAKFLKPFEYMGKISFYVYLFHFPLYILFGDIMKGFYPEFAPYVAILISLVLAVVADKIVLPFFLKKRRVINYVIIAVSLILPVMSLIKAPNTSSIEESIKPDDIVDMEEDANNTSKGLEEGKADYSGLSGLSNSLNEEVFSYFNEAAGFAKVYIPAPAVGYLYGSGYVTVYTRGIEADRSAYTTPDLSRTSLNALNRLNVMVIGDSVAYGARNELSARGYFVDAVGSRDMHDGISLLAGYRAANGGKLPYTIVVSLVTNYSNITVGTLQNLVDTVGAGHRVVLVTGTCRQYSREAQNNAIRAFANSHGNVEVADWATLVSANLVAYTGSDGIHLTPTGRIAYANFISNIVGQ